jgi:hypothetical protein
MSEPISVQPPPPQPFNPAVVSRSGKGCSKPLLIGCAAVLVLLGLGMVVFVVKMPDVMSWLFKQWEAQINTQLPADVTAAEKERLHAAFAAAIHALRTQPVDPAKLKPVQLQMTQIMEMGHSQSKLTHEALARLTAALENLGGVKPPKAPKVAPPAAAAPPLTSDAERGGEGSGEAEEPAKPAKTV